MQLIDISMQLFAGELTNQNREYYKVNDNMRYLCSTPILEISALLLLIIVIVSQSITV